MVNHTIFLAYGTRLHHESISHDLANAILVIALYSTIQEPTPPSPSPILPIMLFRKLEDWKWQNNSPLPSADTVKDLEDCENAQEVTLHIIKTLLNSTNNGVLEYLDNHKVRGT
jgi:hypothetical protein